MASTRQRGSRYTGLYRDAQGNQKSAGTFGTEKEALKASQAAEALASTPKAIEAHRPEKRGKITVAGYFPKFMEGHRLEPTSRYGYEICGRRIIRELGNKTLVELEPADIRAFFRKLEKTLASATVHGTRTVLGEMFRTAVQDGLMDKDLTAGLKLVQKRCKQMKILTPEEYARVMEAAPEHYKLLIRTGVSTGLRWGELMGLQACDIRQTPNGTWTLSVCRVMIDLGTEPPFIRGYGKSLKANRTISIDAELARDLIAAGAGNADGFCFRAVRGGPLLRRNFRHVWLKTCKAAGVEGVRVHDLRHTHASWLLANGADLVSVRDRMGHSDISTTSRYLHVVEQEEDPCLTALSVALRAA